MKIKGTLLKFGVENSVYEVISSDCKIYIPEKVPFRFNFDFTEPPIGYAEVVRTDEGLIFTGEITDPKMIDALTSMRIYDGKKSMGCGGHYNCIDRDDLGRIIEMSLANVSTTFSPVNPDYTFEIVEENDEGNG